MSTAGHWLPSERYLPEGETVTVEAAPGTVMADGLRQEWSSDGLLELYGPLGLHSVRMLDAYGVVQFEVGWHTWDLSTDVQAAMGITQDPGLRAWLQLWDVERVADYELDAVDRLVGEALEDPSLWSVLAARRVAATTQLPILGEVAAAEEHLANDPQVSAVLAWTHPGKAIPPVVDPGVEFAAVLGAQTPGVSEARRFALAVQPVVLGLVPASATPLMVQAHRRLRCQVSAGPQPEMTAWLALAESTLSS